MGIIIMQLNYDQIMTLIKKNHGVSKDDTFVDNLDWSKIFCYAVYYNRPEFIKLSIDQLKSLQKFNKDNEFIKSYRDQRSRYKTGSKVTVPLFDLCLRNGNSETADKIPDKQPSKEFTGGYDQNPVYAALISQDQKTIDYVFNYYQEDKDAFTKLLTKKTSYNLALNQKEVISKLIEKNEELTGRIISDICYNLLIKKDMPERVSQYLGYVFGNKDSWESGLSKELSKSFDEIDPKIKLITYGIATNQVIPKNITYKQWASDILFKTGIKKFYEQCDDEIKNQIRNYMDASNTGLSLLTALDPESLKKTFSYLDLEKLDKPTKLWLYTELHDEDIKSLLLSSIAPEKNNVMNNLMSFLNIGTNTTERYHLLDDNDKIHIIKSHPNETEEQKKHIQDIINSIDHNDLSPENKIQMLMQSEDDKKRSAIWGQLGVEQKLDVMDQFPDEKKKQFLKIIKNEKPDDIAFYLHTISNQDVRESIIEKLGDEKLKSIFQYLKNFDENNAAEVLEKINDKGVLSKLFIEGINIACNKEDHAALGQYLRLMDKKNIKLDRKDLVSKKIKKENLLDYSLKYGFNQEAEKLDGMGLTVSKFPRTALLNGTVSDNMKVKIKSSYPFRYFFFTLFNYFSDSQSETQKVDSRLDEAQENTDRNKILTSEKPEYRTTQTFNSDKKKKIRLNMDKNNTTYADTLDNTLEKYKKRKMPHRNPTDLKPALKKPKGPS